MPGLTGVNPAASLRGICKWFGTVQANDHVDLSIMPGQIHCLVGENGAGKSTLMSILHGMYQADAGEIEVDGVHVDIRSPRDAIAAGVGMVHQHFALVDRFSVLENVILGSEGGRFLRTGRLANLDRLARISEGLGFRVDPHAIVEDLPVGEQQRIEIVKSLFRGAKILILDEPTAVLTPPETALLFEGLRRLRDNGAAVILVTHKLREVMAVSDRVSVMQGGRMVATLETKDTNAGQLGELMVGRRVTRTTAGLARRHGPVRLKVSGLRVAGADGVERVRGVDLEIQAGEIVGVAGVAGNGQTELLEALSGMRRSLAGCITIDGRPVPSGCFVDAEKARRQGIAHVPEDRLRTGLVRSAPAMESAILGVHRKACYRRGPLQNWKAIEAGTRRMMIAADVRPAEPRRGSALFSGGNQQKLVMARELDAAPTVLLVGQPTRGVDIGGIESIHRKLLERRDEGCAILLVSVELDELLALSDRIVVMFEGRIVGRMPAKEVNEQVLGLLMAGSDVSDRDRAS